MLSDSEFDLIQDDQVLLQKRVVLQKIEGALSQTEQRLKASSALTHQSIPPGTLLKSGKISRGENYKGLPYLVLDFPRYSNHEELFLYRTMFWWGNYFICLLISENCGHQIDRSEIAKEDGLLINLGESPWNYDVKDSLYWSPVHAEWTQPDSFLCLAKTFSFEDIDQLPELSGTTFETLISFLS